MSRSIPDSQAVSDIWAAVKGRSVPVKALTKAEYDVLDETQKNADVVYVVQKPGNLPSTPSGPSISIPVGLICIWSGSEVPDGWSLCDGTNGTPDLRGRFVLGESQSHQIGETGGSEEVKLTEEQMPEHRHAQQRNSSSTSETAHNIYANSGNVSAIYSTFASSAFEKGDPYSGYLYTRATGSSKAHSNMPPYYVLAYIMYVGGEV